MRLIGPTAAGPDAAPSLRLLTYNIHKAVGRDQKRSVERIADVIRAHRPDVVALQEVFRFDADGLGASQADQLSELLDLPHRAVGWNVPRKNGVYGNATLSRFPLEDTVNLDLKWRFKKRRSALYSRVRMPMGSLDLYNVHLGLAHFERVRQMRRLVRFTDERAAKGQPVVIAGDTNDWWGRLTRMGQRHGGFACTGHGRAHHERRTFPALLPIGALDRVFIRGGVRAADSFTCRAPLSRLASDHLPLITDLVMAPARLHEERVGAT